MNTFEKLVEIKTHQVFYICYTNSEEPYFMGRDDRVYNSWSEALTTLRREEE